MMHSIDSSLTIVDTSIRETVWTKRHAIPSHIHDKLQVFFDYGSVINVYGKWMVFDHYDQLDTTWMKVRKAIAAGKLYDCSAKCTTMMYNPTKEGPGPSTSGVICVYTNQQNVKGVGYNLIKIVERDIIYKTEVDTRNYKFKHAGTLQQILPRIYWNNGKPSSQCTNKPYLTTSMKRDDIWHLNIVRAPEQFGSKKASGRWILELENIETTNVWHFIKDCIKNGNIIGIIKMVCPPKRDSESQTEKPVFYVYTSKSHIQSVGMKLIELVKRDVTFEHRPQRGVQGVSDTLHWNDGKPEYETKPEYKTTPQPPTQGMWII